MDNIKIHINRNAKFIIDELHKNGYEAYIVGGCVRDALIGKLPDDYDITTNAMPDEIKKIFKKTVDTGIKHGTVSVLLKTESGHIKAYEVTTYRVDGEYIDGRHPENVKFVKSLKEDLSRRDFTVNAMAYNEEDGLIDLFDGKKDLKEKLIRAVGVAKDRYNEDALRMLRAIRFAAKLGFDIEKDTYDAIKEVAPNLSKVSKERIQDELSKILFSAKPRLIKYIYETGLAPYVCEGFETLRPDDKQYVHTKKLYMAYAGLIYKKAKSCDKILRELKLDNDTIKNASILLDIKDRYICITDKGRLDINETAKKIEGLYSEYAQKELIEEIGYDLFFDFLDLISSVENINVKDILVNAKKMREANTPIFIKDLDINGKDLMDIGYKGKEVGVALKYLIQIVHKDESYNNKKMLLDISKEAYEMINK